MTVKIVWRELFQVLALLPAKLARVENIKPDLGSQIACLA
jgi:hypothetical protein